MKTLKEARATKLLSTRELAELAGVAPSTVYFTETGKTTPRFAVIRKLSKVLEVNPTEISEFAAAINAASGDRRHPEAE